MTINDIISEQIENDFQQFFQSLPDVICRAPGRVNLIGEHTDYNEGFVFPVALDVHTYVAAKKRNDRSIHVIAKDFDFAHSEFSLDDIKKDLEEPWSNYVRGVVLRLMAEHTFSFGADLIVTGTVPKAAGLSSSASFEIALVHAFSQLNSFAIEGIEAARIGQWAENNFVGCSCGIMDQLISALGQADHALLLDCQSLTSRHIPLPDGYTVFIVNSNVQRELVDSEYNSRRMQCENAAKKMKKNSLREASLVDLYKAQDQLDENEFKRAKHVISENQRVLAMEAALHSNNMRTVSQLMEASHMSMRDDFDITVPAIDSLVDIVKAVVGNLGGARMTGGGFGGCVVALIPDSLCEAVTAAIKEKYLKATGLHATIYNFSSATGAFA